FIVPPYLKTAAHTGGIRGSVCKAHTRVRAIGRGTCIAELQVHTGPLTEVSMKKSLAVAICSAALAAAPSVFAQTGGSGSGTSGSGGGDGSGMGTTSQQAPLTPSQTETSRGAVTNPPNVTPGGDTHVSDREGAANTGNGSGHGSTGASNDSGSAGGSGMGSGSGNGTGSGSGSGGSGSGNGAGSGTGNGN